jgi:hypothetical protein
VTGRSEKHSDERQEVGAKTIDIQSFIDGRPISAFQWFLVAMCFLVVVADGMDVAIMGFVAPPILQEWNISPAAFGLVISAAPFGLASANHAGFVICPALAFHICAGGACWEVRHSLQEAISSNHISPAASPCRGLRCPDGDQYPSQKCH